MFHQAPQWSLLPAVFLGAALPVTFRKVSSAEEGRRGGLMRISFSGATLSRVEVILGGDGEPHHIAGLATPADARPKLAS